MASQIHLQLCTLRTFGTDGALAPVFVEVSDNETIGVDETNHVSTTYVTEAMVREFGGVNRLFWRITVQGDIDVRIAHAVSPVASGNRVVVALAGTEQFIGVLNTGEKIAVTAQSAAA